MLEGIPGSEFTLHMYVLALADLMRRSKEVLREPGRNGYFAYIRDTEDNVIGLRSFESLE
jgi:hypothetical protein